MDSNRRVLHMVLAFSASLLLLGCGTNNTYVRLAPGPLEIQVTPHGNPSKIIFSGTFTANGGDIYSGFFLDPPAPGSTTYGFLLVKDPVLTATKTSTP